MEPFFFDPFNNRLARDIRNDLSRSFLRALAAKDLSIVQRCGAHYRQQNLAPGYNSYIETRLAKYEEAYAVIEERKLVEVLQQGAVLWNLKLYFEMHELLEPAWKKAEGDQRQALQGLIRAAGMKIHAQNKNMKAAASMASKAMADIMKCPSELAAFGELEAVLAEIRLTLRLSHGTTPVG